MAYLYLVASVFCLSFSSTCAGFFNRKFTDGKNRTPLYNLIVCCTVVIGWGLIWAFRYSFDSAVLPYSLGFGVCYAVGTIMTPLCIRYGPVSLTSLVIQVSVACVTVWGFFFWADTRVTPFSIIGLLLVVTSLALCLSGKKGEQKKISIKWVVFATLLFFGNAGCSIFQKEEQIHFEGAHAPMMMFFATAFAMLAAIVIFLISPKEQAKDTVKRAGYIPAISAVLNLLLNLFIILLASSTISPTVIYPVISVGGLAVSMLLSVVCFRERLTPVQWVGIGLGAIAVTLLNLG